MTDKQVRNVSALVKADASTKVVGEEADGTVLVEHCPREEQIGRNVGGEMRKPAGASRTFLYRIHPDGDRCGYGWGACSSCGTRLLQGDQTLLLPIAVDGGPIGQAEASQYRGVINPKKDAKWGDLESSHPLFDGSDDEARDFLAEAFGTDRFLLNGSTITLELPLVGKDMRPRPSGETTKVTFEAPSSWTVQAAKRGQWWHVIPEESAQTFCTIPLASWRSGAVRNDDAEVTCPWCRARLIAIEIASPPGQAAATDATLRPFDVSPEVVAGIAAGMTPDQIYARHGRTQAVWDEAIREEAWVKGEFNSLDPTPANVAHLRDSQGHRWERIAVRIYGDPRLSRDAQQLYDEAQGRVGAAQESYTGRGRRFPRMNG